MKPFRMFAFCYLKIHLSLADRKSYNLPWNDLDFKIIWPRYLFYDLDLIMNTNNWKWCPGSKITNWFPVHDFDLNLMTSVLKVDLGKVNIYHHIKNEVLAWRDRQTLWQTHRQTHRQHYETITLPTYAGGTKPNIVLQFRFNSMLLKMSHC